MTRALLVLVALAAVAHADGSAGSAGSAAAGSARVIQIPTDASAPDVRAAASPSDVKLGARFTLFVTAVYDVGVEVNLREPIELGAAFEVRRKTSEDHARPDGKHVREWQLEVVAWELGELEVPPVAVTFTAAGKAAQTASNGVPVRVSGVLGDVDDPKLLRDSAAPVRLMSRDWLWIYVAAAGGAVLGVIGFAIWRRRRRRRVIQLVASGSFPTFSRPRIDMTSERALERLLAIERSGVLDADDSRKQGYEQMVEVVREYVGARYRVATLDLTTAELARALARVAPAAECARVDAWLARCELVKYGGLRATVDDARGVLAGARELVIATTTTSAEHREAA